jgi:hypothetical protein
MLDCICCPDCAHEVVEVVIKGLMPNRLDGTPVNILLARDVGLCIACGGDRKRDDRKETAF